MFVDIAGKLTVRNRWSVLGNEAVKTGSWESSRRRAGARFALLFSMLTGTQKSRAKTTATFTLSIEGQQQSTQVLCVRVLTQCLLINILATFQSGHFRMSTLVILAEVFLLLQNVACVSWTLESSHFEDKRWLSVLTGVCSLTSRPVVDLPFLQTGSCKSSQQSKKSRGRYTSEAR